MVSRPDRERRRWLGRGAQRPQDAARDRESRSRCGHEASRRRAGSAAGSAPRAASRSSGRASPRRPCANASSALVPTAISAAPHVSSRLWPSGAEHTCPRSRPCGRAPSPAAPCRCPGARPRTRRRPSGSNGRSFAPHAPWPARPRARQRSPSRWPKRSLTCLRPSISTSPTLSEVSSRAAWAIATVRASSKARRLPRPVSTSTRASRRAISAPVCRPTRWRRTLMEIGDEDQVERDQDERLGNQVAHHHRGHSLVGEGQGERPAAPRPDA